MAEALNSPSVRGFTPSIKATDEAMGRYYLKQAVQDYFNDDRMGKLAVWCEDNGYDTEQVKADVDDPTTAMIYEFDDQFPLTNEPADEAKKTRMIMEIIKKCFEEHNAFDTKYDQVSVPDFEQEGAQLFEMTAQKKKRIVDLYKKQCPSIFNDKAEEDTSFITALGVGGDDFDYLGNLVGDYFRSATAHFKREYAKSEHKKIVTLSVQNWARDSPHFKLLNKMKMWPEKPAEIAEYAVKSFFKHICPRLMFQPNTAIQDSLHETAQYIKGAVIFVYYLSKSLNGQGRAACHFQLDVCFVFKAMRDMEEETDSDPDDEDGDDVKQEDFDIFGDVEARLKANKLNYASKESDASKEMRMFKETFMGLKDKLKSADSRMYPFRKRIVALVDRRKIGTDHDKMTMFEPPEDVREIPSNAVPEWGFAASKTCILPNENYNAEQAAQDAASQNGNSKQRMKKAHLTALSVTPNPPRKDDEGMSSSCADS